MWVDSDKLLLLCREIIVNYTVRVRDKIREGDICYKDTGIDEDIEKYKSLFLELLLLSLGLEDKYIEEHIRVKAEMRSYLQLYLSEVQNESLIQGNRDIVYATCSMIFEQVLSGIQIQKLN